MNIKTESEVKRMDYKAIMEKAIEILSKQLEKEDLHPDYSCKIAETIAKLVEQVRNY